MASTGPACAAPGAPESAPRDAPPRLKFPLPRPIPETMDRLSVIGTVLALAALLGGSVLKGAGISGLWSPAAFVIVIVGTIAAILVQTPMATFKRAMKIVRWVFQPPTEDRAAMIARIVEWSSTARRQGLLGLE